MREELLTVKELAVAVKKSTKFVYIAKRRGFRMVAGVAPLSKFLEFLSRCPNPCSKRHDSKGF